MNKMDPKYFSVSLVLCQKNKVESCKFCQSYAPKDVIYMYSKIRIFWQATQLNVAICHISDYVYRNSSCISFHILPITLNRNEWTSLKKGKNDILFGL